MLPRSAFPLLCAALTLGCIADYSEPEPPSLSEVPALADGDTLIYERALRWWSPPTAQRLLMYERADGSLVLFRERWDGSASYAWAEGNLTSAGSQSLVDARASFDPSLGDPPAGDYDCTYYETLLATLVVDGERHDYLSLCAPEGYAALAGVYEQLSELLLDCPLDPDDYEGELPLVQSDCATAATL